MMKAKKSIVFVTAMTMICLVFGTFVCQANNPSGKSALAASTEQILTLQIGNPQLTVDGESVNIDDSGTVPVIVDDRTLLPVRAVVEAVGGTVEWDGDTRTTTLKYKSDIIKLTIDSTTAYLNDTAQTLDVTPVIINDRTMLPIRFIAESFKFDVAWDNETQTVTITKTSEADEPTASPTTTPTLTPSAAPIAQDAKDDTEAVTKMNVQIGDAVFTATLEDNTAAREFVAMMKEAPVTIDMNDYSGFEKVGSLGRSLTASNSQMTTEAGDIVLYSGNQIVMFYGSNSWSYTMLGHIDDLTSWKEALGNGDITAVFSIAE